MLGRALNWITTPDPDLIYLEVTGVQRLRVVLTGQRYYYYVP
jgi:hypothetical protein